MQKYWILSDRDYTLQITSRRIRLLFWLVVVCFFILVGRLFYLQVFLHEYYATRSQDNRQKLLPLVPVRGLIYSADGILLAGNRPVYDLEILPEQVPDITDTLNRLQLLLSISDQKINTFRADLKQKHKFEYSRLHHSLSEEEVALFAVNQYQFPGVRIHFDLNRYYPMGADFSHLIGYIGRIDQDDLLALDDNDRANYIATDYIGKTGVERYYEKKLHGRIGHQQVEVNAQGRIVRVLSRQAPDSGTDLYLHLRVDMQQAAIRSMRGRRGAIAMMDVRNGAVIAALSSPQYEPNQFVRGISQGAYQTLLDSPGLPLYNRLTQGEYPIASTIKPFLGLIALYTGTRRQETPMVCPGWFRLGDHIFRDWKKGGHGLTSLKSAIAESCDVYFYQLGLDLGVDRMHQELSRFGFGKPSGIDISPEKHGLLPSREWKQARRGERWRQGESVLFGIGQGYVLATPIQLLRAVAVLASQGTLLTPQLLHRSSEQTSITVTTDQEFVRNIPAHHWQTITDAMRDTVHSEWGTARGSGRGASYEFAGKTGTAQVIQLDVNRDQENIPEKFRDHALFIAFAPLPNPEVAIAVVLENAGSGSSAAAPVARELLDYYMESVH